MRTPGKKFKYLSLLFLISGILLPNHSYGATQDSIPQKVQKIIVQSVEQKAVNLKWQHSLNANYYQLELRKLNGQKIKLWKKIQENKRIISSNTNLLNPGTTYQIRIKSCNDHVCNRWSPYKQFKTLTPPEDTPDDNEEDSNDNEIITPSPTCSSDIYNCSDFISQSAAQSIYNQCLSEVGYDVHGLDGDNNGAACESLP